MPTAVLYSLGSPFLFPAVLSLGAEIIRQRYVEATRWRPTSLEMSCLELQK